MPDLTMAEKAFILVLFIIVLIAMCFTALGFALYG